MYAFEGCGKYLISRDIRNKFLEEYYRDYSDAENRTNAVTSFLAQLKLINTALDASSPSNYRSSVIPMLDGLLQNADLPIDISGEIIADAIYNYTSLLMNDDASPDAAESGAVYAVDHAREIAVSKTQSLLAALLSMLNPTAQSRYQYLATEQAARSVARILGYVLFGNYVEEPAVSLLKLSVVMTPAFSMTASFNMDQPEIVTAKTFIQNFRSLGTAHVHCDMLSWLRADDSCYILADLPEGEYTSDQTVHLYTANGAEIHYTTDGSAPTAESAVYDPANGISLKYGRNAKAYEIKAISVSDGEISPVWTYKYDLAKKAAPAYTGGILTGKTENKEEDKPEEPGVTGKPQEQEVIPKQPETKPEDKQENKPDGPVSEPDNEQTASAFGKVNPAIIIGAAVVVIAAVIIAVTGKKKDAK